MQSPEKSRVPRAGWAVAGVTGESGGGGHVPRAHNAPGRARLTGVRRASPISSSSAAAESDFASDGHRTGTPLAFLQPHRTRMRGRFPCHRIPTIVAERLPAANATHPFPPHSPDDARESIRTAHHKTRNLRRSRYRDCGVLVSGRPRYRSRRPFGAPGLSPGDGASEAATPDLVSLDAAEPQMIRRTHQGRSAVCPRRASSSAVGATLRPA